MKRLILIALFACAAIQPGYAQFPVKFDSLYRKLYPAQFCEMLRRNDPNLVLIDVRSPGEYSDTSGSASLNLGHLRGAINIEFTKLIADPTLLEPYKDKTVVFYCSHSQRSRRTSKAMAEKGYTNFYNLNGGMSVLTQLNESEFPCKSEWIVSSLPYKNVSRDEAMNLIRGQKGLQVIDIREAAQFNATDTLSEQNVGRIRGAINRPYATFKTQVNTLGKDKSTPILLYGTAGDGDPARAAAVLAGLGYSKVHVLLEGLPALIASQSDLSFLEKAPAYRLMNARRAYDLLTRQPAIPVFDARSQPEFENKQQPVYRNMGRLKNAVHVLPETFETVKLPIDKTAPVLVYGNNSENAYRFAELLVKKGYTQVNLMPSLYDFMAGSFNDQAMRGAGKWLVEHEGLY